MTQVELHDDWHDAYEQGKYRYAEARGMPCGHPRGCTVQDEEGTVICAWCEEVARLREELKRLCGDDGHPQLIPDAGMLHRLVYAADMWWEGQGEQSQQDIAAGYALVEKIHAAAGDATDEEEATVDRA